MFTRFQLEHIANAQSSNGGVDDVVPYADSKKLVRNSGVILIEFGSAHRLADPESLAIMLEACEGTIAE